MLKKSKATILSARFHNGLIHSIESELTDASRVTRIVDDSTRFLVLRVHKKTEDATLNKFLETWIHEGLVVNKMKYAFFGFPENYIKNGRIVFFREDHVWTVKRVHECLGDLNDVFRNWGYGKYSARLGLSFSSTVESLDVPSEQALLIPDWEAKDGSLHTDGCGMIRDSFAAQLCKLHDLSPETSVFQIRRGGIKGLLVRYPDERFDRLCWIACGEHGRNPPIQIAYRPSMLKYKGGPTMLELNDHSMCPAPARLNVQFIILLLSLKIPSKIFEEMVKEQLELIGSITHDRATAERYIKGELDAADTSAYNQDLFALLLAKHDLQEPYVRWRLEQYQKLQYDSLRSKMNLRVEESCRVFGVVDEDGVLAEDEVFINLPGRTGVLDREVLVGRNPCYSPGDLRKFRAVIHEDLKHHKYCIVFSRKAKHSIPDTMCSGDLDGDEYFVTWDPALIPKDMAPPLERKPAAAARSGARPNTRRQADIMKSEAIDTFVQHRFSRLLGEMVTEWGRAAEATPQLARSPFARSLVPLIESAHDIMKAGDDPAGLRKRFRALMDDAVVTRPYVSPVQVLRNMVPQASPAKVTEFECDPALILRMQSPELFERFTAEAHGVLRRYNHELTVAITEDNNDGDFEAAAERDRRKEVRHADRVKQSYRDKYFGGGTFQEQFEQRVRASAWYVYGYSQKKQSFAWLGERWLNDIRANWTNGGKPILYVGTASMPPPAVNMEWSASTCTLMDESEAEGKYQPPNKNQAKSARNPPCPAVPPAPPAQKQNRDDALQSVDASVNPKPQAPVASRVPACLDPHGHAWRLGVCNGAVRNYRCAVCGADVHERKLRGVWVGAVPRAQPGPCGSPMACVPSPATPVCAGGDAVRMSPDGGRCAAGGIAGTGPGHGNGNGSGRDAGGPRRLSQMSSLGSELRSLINLPLDPEPDVKPALRTGCAARLRGEDAKTRQAAARWQAALVSEHPKPRWPVGTRDVPACAQGTHAWNIRANGTSRRYECVCGVVVKERKDGVPARWVAAP